jgi:regulator of sigma E protease
LNWIPFGGFVRLQGENATTEAERSRRGSFNSVSVPARVAILTAGVAMNFLCALVIFSFGFSVGRWIPTYLSFKEMQAAAQRGEIHLKAVVLIDDIVSGGGAAQVGVPKDSILLRLDDQSVPSPEHVATMQEGKKRVTYTLLTGENFSEEKTFTIPLKDGRAGVVLRPFPQELSSPRRSLASALLLSLREARVVTVQTVAGMARLFFSLARTGTVPEGITGIVGIAQLTHASIQEGFATYLRLIALLSLSLAVLNILPLPALDGGRLLFVLVEAVRQRPANRRFELAANAIGFAFLIFLILLITYHDILRLF